jgi:hypothetical protein
MSHITIHVLGGVVQDVEGLPVGWTYEVLDQDNPETPLDRWLEQHDMPQ